jgi:hypothetical protein
VDQYVYGGSPCQLPVADQVVFMEHYHDTTARVCQALCTQLEPERCFGIFYNVTHQICSLTSFSLQSVTLSSCTSNTDNSTRHGLLYFRRHTCLGEYNAK